MTTTRKDAAQPHKATRPFYQLPQDITSRRDLSGNAKILWAVIRDHARGNGHAWPGMRLLAQETGLSRVTIMQATKRLEQTGLLEIEHRGNGRANHYRVPDGTGKEAIPVKKADSTGKETIPQPVKKLYPKQRELRNRPAAKRTAKVRWNEDETRFDIEPEVLATWQRDYPSLDIEQEVRKAGQWHAANQKWKSAWQRALVRWLNRAVADPPKAPEAQLGPGIPLETDVTLDDLIEGFGADAPVIKEERQRLAATGATP